MEKAILPVICCYYGNSNLNETDCLMKRIILTITAVSGSIIFLITLVLTFLSNNSGYGRVVFIFLAVISLLTSLSSLLQLRNKGH